MKLNKTLLVATITTVLLTSAIAAGTSHSVAPAFAELAVTPGITVNPIAGPPGRNVTLTGVNFTAIAGTAVNIRFGTTVQGTVQVATFTTNSSGGFSGAFFVPTLPTSPPIYYINATDSYGLSATTTFTIALLAFFLSPTSGATGSMVNLTAFGLGTTGGLTFNVTIGGAVLTPSSNLVSAIAAGTATVTVPTMPVGTYNVVVTDNLGLPVSASFVVNATSILTVNPSAAPAGTSGVALTLRNFGAGATLNFFIVNATRGFSLVVTPGTVITNASGTATASFNVPALAVGSYSIIANESTGLWNATSSFAVTQVVPEFPSSLIMVLALAPVIATAIFIGRKQKKNTKF
jgi:hypothetical protein